MKKQKQNHPAGNTDTGMKKAGKKRKKGSFTTTFLLVLLMLAGIGIMAYPSVSNWWNSFHQTQALSGYRDAVAGISDYSSYFSDAETYNEKLSGMQAPFVQYTDIHQEYHDALNIMGDGMIGYISIEKLGVQLPIYHGTSEEVLNVAAGHIEGTSLPIGGEGTHAAISSHRGLPTAKLFTDLDEMEIGDIFTITVLDRLLTYQVDQILVVLPHETDALKTVDGEDYCTLVTCTPYGVNSHRLLVRGKRTDNATKAAILRNEAGRISFKFCTAATMTAFLIISFVVMLVKKVKAAKTPTLAMVRKCVAEQEGITVWQKKEKKNIRDKITAIKKHTKNKHIHT